MLDNDEPIILYHGTNCSFTNPDLSKCKNFKDFGKGFYLTTDEKQAIRFAKLSKFKSGSDKCFVNKYELSDYKELTKLFFNKADSKWFKFVCSNRSKMPLFSNFKKEGFDIIIGKIADDATAAVINNFLSGVYGHQDSKNAINFAIKLLLPTKLSDEICLKTEKALEHLKFISFEEITDEKK